jgi:hypothetical protein
LALRSGVVPSAVSAQSLAATTLVKGTMCWRRQ